MGYPSADQRARRRYLVKPTKITIDKTTSASCASLVAGVYQVWGNVDWYFIQGSLASATAASDAWPLLAYQTVEMYTGEAEDASIAGLAVSDSGTVYIGRLS